MNRAALLSLYKSTLTRVGGWRFLKKRAVKRALIVLAALILLPWICLFIAAAFTDLPTALSSKEPPDVSLVVRDRSGVVLREYRAKDGMRARYVPLSDMGDLVPRAMIAAEDLRFRYHFGVDPIAMTRAAGQGVLHGRLVSGASTLTQQLARTVVARPRTVGGKLREMAIAIRIEASLSKDQILEQYLNRVTFGPGVRGFETASRFYFDKPSKDLSLSEAAALAGMPRGPSLYDPRKGTTRLLQRRNTVLERMRSAGLATDEEVERALAEPLAIAPRGGGLGAPHLTLALTSGKLPDLGENRAHIADLTLTIDRGLQRQIELSARQVVSDLKTKKAGTAAVIVIENSTGQILAYLGSHNFEDEQAQGQNDGVFALRQPGSTLKPFIYGLAMERLGYTAGTLIPDVETHFNSGETDFAPNNYDGRFHGAVLLREALANSYNVPAVRTAAALGPERVLPQLQALGFSTLTKPPSEYGVAIALGDGETRLIDLANAYATLARGGVYIPVRAVKSATLAGGEPWVAPRYTPQTVIDPAVAVVLTDILSDDRARAAAFGRQSVLDLPFPVAAKTGTSKGFRDNLTVGYTREVTVAVWVGNFDGSSMEGVSGVTGAGPLFHAAVTAAQALYPRASSAPLRDQLLKNGDLPIVETAEICPLSGALAGPNCPHHRTEIFPTAHSFEHHAPTCKMHTVVQLDRRTGLKAGRSCPSQFVEKRVVERFPPELTSWASSVRRPVAPADYSPLCPAAPGEDDESSGSTLRITYPPNDAVFVLDPHAAGRQSIVFRAAANSNAQVRFVVDGQVFQPRPGELSVEWPLVIGDHTAHVETADQSSESIHFKVGNN
ncbi:MAG: penicillin-binding protein 1C [Polyangiaceae bacterium]|nr:penicillin-binding protein 1C [Polyangiaceae bacterium]